jgi:hypothetical protein
LIKEVCRLAFCFDSNPASELARSRERVVVHLLRAMEKCATYADFAGAGTAVRLELLHIIIVTNCPEW